MPRQPIITQRASKVARFDARLPEVGLARRSRLDDIPSPIIHKWLPIVRGPPIKLFNFPVGRFYGVRVRCTHFIAVLVDCPFARPEIVPNCMLRVLYRIRWWPGDAPCRSIICYTACRHAVLAAMSTSRATCHAEMEPTCSRILQN